ncbi:MAG: ankyrin repeat domain-containing protein [Vicinamibacterales bacterium]|nr:ankyrin repeat domain-containing protein [Vicinamibacterales bacterium]
MHTLRTLALGTALVACCSMSGAAQALTPAAVDFVRLADGAGAQAFNRAFTVGTEDGRVVARLDARTGDGGVLLDGIQLGDGIIDVDLKGKDVAQRSFLGLAFHVVDWTTLDAVYFRPFNFRGADAGSRSHSVQYVSHPGNTWQRLRTERPGQFEQAIDPPPDPNGWFHARIVLANSRVEVFVNGADKPALSVEDLSPHRSGGVALFVGNGSDGAFANLTITPTAPAGPPPASTQTIFQASATGNLPRVRTLVEADAQAVNASNPGGLTPLHMAAIYGQRAVSEYLLANGADVNAVSRHSGRPLDIAGESDHTAYVSWLQARGAAFTPASLQVIQVAPHTRRLAFPWGMMNNVVAFSTAEGAVVVDSGFLKRTAGDLRTTIEGVSKPGVRYLINSHSHWDHIAGNTIAPSPGAIITAASLAANTAGLPVTRDGQPLTGRSGRTLPAPYTLRVGGLDFKLIPRPGLHSDGDLMTYVPSESVVAMGDLLLSESIPAIEDIVGYLSFLDDVLDVFPENTTFISGHGRDLNTAGVRAYRETLAAMVAIVRTNLAAGRTAEQMVRDDVLARYKAQFSLLEFLTPDALIPRVVSAVQRGSLK